jgi:hypothetical protein
MHSIETQGDRGTITEANGDQNKETLKPAAKLSYANLQNRLEPVFSAHGGEKVQKPIK